MTRTKQLLISILAMLAVAAAVASGASAKDYSSPTAILGSASIQGAATGSKPTKRPPSKLASRPALPPAFVRAMRGTQTQRR